jgi:hypothetical protein
VRPWRSNPDPRQPRGSWGQAIQRRRQQRGSRRLWFLVGFVILAETACGPGEPSYDELVVEPAFAATMPGASEDSSGGDDARSTVEGSFNSFATRLLRSDDDEKTVLAWHSGALEADGWVPVDFAYIAMRDGHVPANAWRRGDLVIGLGFPDPDQLSRDGREVPGGTWFELTITYQPPT